MPKWKRGGIWQGYVRVNGISTKPRTTGCRDEKAAVAVLAEWERELADPAYATSKKASLDQAFNGLLKQYAGLVSVGKRAPETASYYTEKLGTIARLVGPKLPLSLITAAVVDDFIAARREEEASEYTVGKELDAWKVALRYAKRAHAWTGDIEGIFPKFSKAYEPRDRSLADDELIALLALLPKDLAAQVAFSVSTSAEARCLMKAQRSDAAEDGRYVLLRGTKRELRWRTVPIVTGWQKTLLRFAMANAQGKDSLLFKTLPDGLRQGMYRVGDALGIPRASPNDLRRTFAVGMRESGFPLELIAPLMGHADTRMLERVYGRLSPEQLRDRMVLALNALAAYEKGASDQRAKPLIPAHSDAANLLKLAPRAGFEPATYGLTVNGGSTISLVLTPEYVSVA